MTRHVTIICAACGRATAADPADHGHLPALVARIELSHCALCDSEGLATEVWIDSNGAHVHALHRSRRPARPWSRRSGELVTPLKKQA